MASALKKQKVAEGGDAMDVDAKVTTPGKKGGAAYVEGNTHDLMPLYYGRLFPYQEMYKWLSYGQNGKHPKADAAFFKKREFCFTLEGDIFVRYQSFRDADELRSAIKDRCPAKIDIGPVFNVDPQKRTAYTSGSQAFAPVERELVFDVDMTDYDDIRTCCSGASICNKCWPFMTIAIKAVDNILEEEFGFEHRLWVFSGRRGVHCWVADRRARFLTDEQRSSLANFFSVYKGREAGKAKLGLTSPLHPTLQRIHDEILQPAFVQWILPNQRLLEDEAARESMLAMVPDEDVAAHLRDEFRSKPRNAGDQDVNVARWERLEAVVTKKAGAKGKGSYALNRCIQEIVFAYTYPRLDAEVSKHMNHLLKAPFCVHPKTGRVCVPMDPATAEHFDPFQVPTVAQLLNELDEAAVGGAGGNKGGEDWRRTSMKEAVDLFYSSFLDKLNKEGKQELAERSRAAVAVAATTLAY